jgi:hypothetical protein
VVGEVKLRFRVSLLRRQAVPLHSLNVILRDALAFAI